MSWFCSVFRRKKRNRRHQKPEVLEEHEVREEPATEESGYAVQTVDFPSGKVSKANLYLLEDKKCLLLKYSKSQSTEVPIASVREVVSGVSERMEELTKTEKLSKLFGANGQFRMDCTLALLVGEKPDVTIIVAKNDEQFLAISGPVKQMQLENRKSTLENQDDWVKYHFSAADKNQDGLISIEEARQQVETMRLGLHKHRIEVMFHKLSKAGTETLDSTAFGRFCGDILQLLPEVDAVFEAHSSDKRLLDQAEFRAYLKTELKAEVSPLEVSSIFDQAIREFEPSNVAKNAFFLTIDGFRLMYLRGSNLVSAFNYQHRKIYQDMSQPLNRYWIASSHNTYLIGQQLVGVSSAEMYRKVLRDGCRCVELDIWDGKKEPVVTHGHTMTSELPLSEALQAIAETAFVASEYPVILSIENHMSEPQQLMAAKMFKEVFGESLYTKELPEKAFQLPSPDDLKHKILVKSKTRYSKAKPKDNQKDGTKEQPRQSKIMKMMRLSSSKNKEDDSSSTGSSSSDEDEEEPDESNANRDRTYESLVTVCKPAKFISFAQAIQQHKFNNMSSLCEPKAFRLLEKERDGFINHTNHFLVRTYPKGSRINSSNYDPLGLWSVGAQLIALNYQTYDDPMVFNAALFNDNGRCGYVLKPPLEPGEATGNGLVTAVSVKILGALQLPCRKESGKDVQVVVSVSGADDCPKSKTEVVKKNAFRPAWREEFTFNLKRPELDFLWITVLNAATGKTIGQNVTRVHNVAQGLRCMRLSDTDGNPCETGFLLVQVTKKPVQ